MTRTFTIAIDTTDINRLRQAMALYLSAPLDLTDEEREECELLYGMLDPDTLQGDETINDFTA